MVNAGLHRVVRVRPVRRLRLDDDLVHYGKTAGGAAGTGQLETAGKTPDAPVLPVIEQEVVNQPDAMHQLYAMWGYDASADDALCQNAAKVNLMCKQGNASTDTLANDGYPWVSEIKTGDHINTPSWRVPGKIPSIC